MSRAGAATDSGNDGNLAASRYSVEADVDLIASIHGPALEMDRQFWVVIHFSKPVTGFEKGT